MIGREERGRECYLNDYNVFLRKTDQRRRKSNWLNGWFGQVVEGEF